MNIFIISAALALLLLIIQFIRQVRRTAIPKSVGEQFVSIGCCSLFSWLALEERFIPA